MTSLGKTIITLGILILTLSSLAWIVLSDGRWFAGGLAVFFGCILSGVILSVETKNTNSNHQQEWTRRYRQPPLQPPRPRPQPPPQNPPTAPLPKIPPNDDWQQPSSPPPDANNDPFYKPSPTPRTTNQDD